MKNLSARFAFYGDITGVDDTYVRTKSGIKKKWADLNAEEISNFYRKTSDSNPIGLAGILMQNITDDRYKKARLALAESDQDISIFLEYFEEKYQKNKPEEEPKKPKEPDKPITKPEPKPEPSPLVIKKPLIQIVQNLPQGLRYDEKLSKKHGIPVYINQKDNSPMVYIPKGDYFFSNIYDHPDLPSLIEAHHPYGFFIDKNEITNNQFQDFLKQTQHKTD